MKINFIANPGDGCSWHRIVLPAKYFKSDGIDQTVTLSGEGKYDIAYYNRFIQTMPYSVVEQWKSEGTKIVVDMDDYWELPPNHCLYKDWYNQGINKIYQHNLINADLVTVTNFQLRDKVFPLNKNVVVIPNALPYGEESFNRQNWIGSDKIRFIYAGGVTHVPDVNLLLNTFKRISTHGDIKSKAEFILAGYNPSNFKIRDEWAKMKFVFDESKCSTILPTRSLEDYLTFYDQADVVLIPLHQSEFSKHKSILKILEAATRELPVICSRVLPYTEVEDYPGIMWVDSKTSWLDHIKYCIKNPSFVREAGQALAEKVKENYNLFTWNETRKQIFEHIIS